MLWFTLGVEESRHPEDVWSADKHPGVELLIPLQQLGEPKADGGGLPGHLSPGIRHTGVKQVVQGITQALHR